MSHGQSRYGGQPAAGGSGGAAIDFDKIFATPGQQPAAKPSAAAAPTPMAAQAPRRVEPLAPTVTPSTQAYANNQGRSYTRPQSNLRGVPGGNGYGASSLRGQGTVGGTPRVIDNLSARELEERARALLNDMLLRHPKSQLDGTPMRLSSVITTGDTRDRQEQLVASYWALMASTADYYLGLHEADEVERLRRSLTQTSTLMTIAQDQLRKRISTSLMSAQVAQARLSSLMRNNTRVLPTETPFCGPYATRYDEIFPTGGPAEARLLNELLPLRLADMYESAAGIRRSERWLEKVKREAGSNSDGAGMVQALELLALNRRAFVQHVRLYNLHINRYTQFSTPGEVDTARLVAMLVRTPRTPTLATKNDGNSSANRQYGTGGASTPR